MLKLLFNYTYLCSNLWFDFWEEALLAYCKSHILLGYMHYNILANKMTILKCLQI